VYTSIIILAKRQGSEWLIVFANCYEKPYPLCKDIRSNDLTIIDNEESWRFFRDNNGNPESVPPTVKDKKKLREKLMKRGFAEEVIKRYLSYSRLSDPDTFRAGAPFDSMIEGNCNPFLTTCEIE